MATGSWLLAFTAGVAVSLAASSTRKLCLKISDGIPAADGRTPRESERGIQVRGLAGARGTAGRDQLEDVPARNEHGGQAAGIDQTLVDQLDLVHQISQLPSVELVLPSQATAASGTSASPQCDKRKD